jgi:ribosomal protein S18 acetylase RimI-like enzyme
LSKISKYRIFKGLPHSLVEEAVKIYYDAFSKKINPLVGNKEKAIPFIIQTTDFNACFYAVTDKRLLGIAGIQDKDNNFTRNIRLRELLKEFNLFRSLLIRYIYGYKTSKVKKGVIRVDSIAVAAQARGMGIGTALLKEVFRYASDNGLENIKLEVVNTNPEARELYERLGFKAEKEVRYGFITRKAGFTSEFIMSRKV